MAVLAVGIAVETAAAAPATKPAASVPVTDMQVLPASESVPSPPTTTTGLELVGRLPGVPRSWPHQFPGILVLEDHRPRSMRVLIYSLSRREVIKEFPVTTTWPTFAFSPRGDRVLVSGRRFDWQVYDESWAPVFTIQSGVSLPPEFSRTGEYLRGSIIGANGSPTGSPSVHDARTGAVLQRSIWGDFTPQDRYMIENRYLIDPRTGNPGARLPGDPVRYSPTGDRAVLRVAKRDGSRNGDPASFILVEIPSGREVRDLTRVVEADGIEPGENTMNPHTQRPGFERGAWSDFRFSRDGRSVWAKVHESIPLRGLNAPDVVDSVWLYDAATGALRVRYIGYVVVDYDSEQDLLALGTVSSHYGARGAVAGHVVKREHPAIQIVRATTGEVVRELDPWRGSAYGSTRFAPGAGVFRTSFRDGTGFVRASDGALLLTLENVTERQLAISSDGIYAAAPLLGRTALYRIESGELVASVEGSVTFLRNGYFVRSLTTGEHLLYRGDPAGLATVPPH